MASVATPPPTAPAQWGHGKGLASGQREPIYSLLTPYASMPKHITGPTVWTADELTADPSQYLRTWTAAEIHELESAIAAVEARALPLAEVCKATFPLPTVGPVLEAVRQRLVHGNGVALLRGLPVKSWSTRQCSICYLGIGSYIGPRLPQNGAGHVLGHVKDLSAADDATPAGAGRIYRTHAAQAFHCDDCDVVGLLCLETARRGGESQIVSSHHVWNVLCATRPDVAACLAAPHWFYDRKGEKSAGEADVMRVPGFYHHAGRLTCKWDSYYVAALDRFWAAGALPPYTPAQHEAVRVMEATCTAEALWMRLEVGDVQFVANTHVLHARSAYEDDTESGRQRWLQRLWLSTPESEGGWKLPFADSAYEKRGGVQVDETPETYPLEAE